MAKIPLYQDKANLQPFKGQQLNPEGAINLAGAEEKADAALFDGIFKLGAEALNLYKEEKTKADDAAYNIAISNLEQRLINERPARSDLSDEEFQEQVVNKQLNEFMDFDVNKKISKDPSKNGSSYNRLNKKWQTDRLQFDLKYSQLTAKEKIKNNEVTQIQLANMLIKKGDPKSIKEGYAIIDNIGTLNEEEKNSAKRSGQYSRILNIINNANSVKEIKDAFDETKNENKLVFEFLKPDQLNDLKVRADNKKVSIQRKKYQPTYEELKDMGNNNQLTPSIVIDRYEEDTITNYQKDFLLAKLNAKKESSMQELENIDREKVQNLRDKITDFVQQGSPNKKESNLEYYQSLVEIANRLMETDEIPFNLISDSFEILDAAFMDDENIGFWESGTTAQPNTETKKLQYGNSALRQSSSVLEEITKVLPANIAFNTKNNAIMDIQKEIAKVMKGAKKGEQPYISEEELDKYYKTYPELEDQLDNYDEVNNKARIVAMVVHKRLKPVIESVINYETTYNLLGITTDYNALNNENDILNAEPPEGLIDED